jgi:ABC-2 type transport system permease protein
MIAYLSVFRIRFSQSLQHRTAAYAGIVTQFAWGFMGILAFGAFYRASPDAFPMTFAEFTSYIWIQQAFLAMFMMWFFENDIFSAIVSGNVAYELVRPIDLYGKWFFQGCANRLARAALRCMPILAVALFLPENMRLHLPPNAQQFVLFVLSAALSLFVVAAFSMLVYIVTFSTLSSQGPRMISIILVEFMAGAVIPLPFFPNGFRQIAELLPFGAMQNMPLRIYSGNISGIESLRGIALQVFWLVALVIIGKLMMKRALKKIVVQGG